jgi:hypothetical protein
VAIRKGKCVNLGGCDNALSGEIIEVQEGDEFVCPNKDCGRPLQPLGTSKTTSPYVKAISIGAAGVLIVGSLAWALWPTASHPQTHIATNASPNAAAKPFVPPMSSAPDSCGLVAAHPPDVDRLLIYLKQGMTYAINGQYELAPGEFRQVEKVDPNFVGIHNDIAARRAKAEAVQRSRSGCAKGNHQRGLFAAARRLVVAAFCLHDRVSQQAAPVSTRAATFKERLKQAKATAHYNLACIQSRKGALSDSIRELQQAVDAGFHDSKALHADPDLAQVRATPEFKTLLSSLTAGRG